MARIEKEIFVNAPVEKVFARTDDPNNAVEDMAGTSEVKDISGQGLGMRFTQVHKVFGKKIDYQCEIVEYEPPERKVIHFKGGALEGNNTILTEEQDGGTKLTFVSEFNVPIPLIGKLAESVAVKLVSQDYDLTLANLKAHCEAEA